MRTLTLLRMQEVMQRVLNEVWRSAPPPKAVYPISELRGVGNALGVLRVKAPSPFAVPPRSDPPLGSHWTFKERLRAGGLLGTLYIHVYIVYGISLYIMFHTVGIRSYSKLSESRLSNATRCVSHDIAVSFHVRFGIPVHDMCKYPQGAKTIHWKSWFIVSFE